MKDQPKTPGAMVLVERDVLEIIGEALGRFIPGGRTHALIIAILDAPADHVEDARAMVEQTPASPMAERIRQAMITDSGQDGVSIAEGRFGKAMAALCVQLDGQTPAVGGELSSTMMRIAADLVCEKPLRNLYALCESQSRVSSVKLHGLLECAGGMMKQTGIDIRRAIDKDRQSRPAPVKAALPERRHMGDPRHISLVEGWNACLDEIARLNTPQEQ